MKSMSQWESALDTCGICMFQVICMCQNREGFAVCLSSNLVKWRIDSQIISLMLKKMLSIIKWNADSRAKANWRMNMWEMNASQPIMRLIFRWIRKSKKVTEGELEIRMDVCRSTSNRKAMIFFTWTRLYRMLNV